MDLAHITRQNIFPSKKLLLKHQTPKVVLLRVRHSLAVDKKKRENHKVYDAIVLEGHIGELF